MTRAASRTAGFTLAELLFATAIMMIVVASTLTLMRGAQGMFAAQAELTDLQQRLRLGVNALTRDLLMAGAGTYSGPMAGSLGAFFGTVLPYRLGAVNADAVGQYFTDRLTVVYVPPTVAQTRLADPLGPSPAFARITHDPGCPAADSCGFERGMAALVMDQTGAWDTFTVGDVQGSVLQLLHRGSQAFRPYPAGSYISEVITHTYWLKTDPDNDAYQLMRYDGDQADVPIVDNVVGLNFEYFGQAESGIAGEPLVVLSPSQLTDGPWRPDAGSAGRYDADLLRVRRIRVTLRVQASAAFRAAAGPLFMYAGTSTTSERYLPDREITFDVAPRNLARQ
jgi:type II secretory pathway pseudopilin PulG